MGKPALVNRDLGSGNFPILRRGRDEHGARRGRRRSQLIPRICDGCRSAGPLHRSEGEIVVELRVCRREFRAHLRPVRVQLLGDDCREPRGDALPHVEVLNQHCHAVVRRDADKSVWHWRSLGSDAGLVPIRCLFGLRPLAEGAADDERTRSRGGRDQEIAT